MSNERFEALRKQLGQARRERDSLDDERQAALGRLKAVEARLAALRRAGKDNENDGQGAGALRERAALEQEIRRLDAAQTERRRVADGLAAEFGRLFASPEEQLARLDDANPILLLPVRLETRFMPAANGTELWVRIFPDDVAIDSHQPGLTPDEIVAGKSYWEQFWRAGDDGARQRGAWRVLVNRCGRHRAAWIARSLTPANPGDRPAAPVPDDQPLNPPPAFPEPPPSPALWSRAPHSRVMPDRFVILTYQGGVANPPVLGAPIPDPLIVGPDPLAAQPSLEQLGDKLVVDASFAWLTDFEAAVKIGMGLKIPLTPAQARAGFDRVLCLGIRFADDAREGAATLESLLDAHHYASGFALVPQGTPTNNTEDAPSGVAREDADADTSFDVEQGAPLFTPLPANDPARSDGQRLAEALGVRPDVLQHIQHSNREDGREARAMNTALFPATLGYFMEEMMHPVFDLDAIRKTRAFFIEFVSARGALPAIRIGKQPYGVLPTTAFSRLNVRGLMRDAFPVQLQAVLRRMEQTWNDLKAQVKHAGSGGDPEETFLNILGLQPATAELHKRGALDDDVAWNYAIFLGLGANSTHWWENLKLLGELLVSSLGYDFAETPKIFKMSFLENHRVLDGPWVDDAPLSEEKPVRPLPAQALNYIGWLAQAKLDDVRDQRLGLDAEGKPIPPPRALLYLLLRHALLLEYWDTSMKFYVRENVVPLAARREVTTINLQGARESTRWDYLDAALPQVTGNRKMSEFLDLSTLAFVDQVEVQELREVGDALRLLANLPTARLERLLAEHLALVSYRLDAWQMGLLNLRMRAMGMAAPPTLTHAAAAASARTGTYLGMYGWLENLRPAAPRQRVPRREIPEGFDEPGAPPLVYAPDNAGHVHMPSIAHAGTAAVLLNAHLTHAGPDNNRPFSVNLSSERTRRALWFFEGILNGQDLSALLGYQFERGLHERHPGLELDQFILPIRQKYPIAVDPKKDTPPGASSEAIAARDVLDGEALLRKGGAYPYQVAGLPPAASPEGRAIQDEVERLGDSLDAVGDLALSEGVFQVLRGNFDRGGAILEGVNRGAFFQEPEVVRTPRSGTGLTHRLAIAFDMNSPAANPWPAVPMTPRALAEPRLNHWIGVLLGAPEDIRCLARFRSNPDDPFSLPRELSLADLAVQPLDVMYLSLSDLADEGTELEKRLAFVLRAREGLHTQVELRLDFIARDGGWGVGVKTFFEVMPLVNALRDLVTGARPTAADDFILPTDTIPDTNDRKRYDAGELRTRLLAARASLAADAASLLAAADAARTAALPFPGGIFSPLRAELLAAAAYGIPDAVPYSAVDAVPAGLNSEDADAFALAMRDDLVSRADTTLAVIAKRLDAADEALTRAQSGSLTADQRAEAAMQAGKALFGDSFRAIPLFAFHNPAEVANAYAGRAGLLAGAPALAVDEWLQGVSLVRPKAAALETLRLLAEAFDPASADAASVTVMQLPHGPADRWLALPFDPSQPIPGDKLSILLQTRPGYDPAQPQGGLILDEWTEVIPRQEETTGIAFHFNRPNAEAPNALLLAIAPDRTGAWRWQDLVDCLHETLELAKQRAVEPDHIDRTAYAQLLPATVSAVARGLATISLNLSANLVAASLVYKTES